MGKALKVDSHNKEIKRERSRGGQRDGEERGTGEGRLKIKGWGLEVAE